MATIPHFDIPFRFVNRAAAITEQDSEHEIDNCVETIVRYQHGDRPENADFGIPDLTFSLPGLEADIVRGAIRTYEPRADVDVDDPKIEELVQTIAVRREPQ